MIPPKKTSSLLIANTIKDTASNIIKKIKYRSTNDIDSDLPDEATERIKKISEFNNEYLDSSKFKERVKAQGYDFNSYKRLHEKKASNTKIELGVSPNGAHSTGGTTATPKITIDNSLPRNKVYGKSDTVIAHEFGHNFDNPNMNKYITDNNTFTGDHHEARPRETVADVHGARYELYKTGKYDGRFSNFTNEAFNEMQKIADKDPNSSSSHLLKKLKSSKVEKDLKKAKMNDKKVIFDVMNKTVNNTKNRDVVYAAMGGKLRPSSRKRAIVPVIGASLISGGISMVSSALGMGAAAKAKKEAEKQRRKDEMNGLTNQFLEQKIGDEARYNEANIYGEDDVEYYADGGDLEEGSNSDSNLTPEQMAILQKSMAKSSQAPADAPVSESGYQTQGGFLKPIGDGIEEVVGNKHNETTIDGVSGVQLHANGEIEAEVEDKEVIADGTKVYSQRLKFDKKNSYADKIKQVVKQRNKLEKKQEVAKSKREKNTIERQLAGLNMAENAVFEHQEAAKYREGIEVANKTFAMGGKIGDPPGKKTKRPSYEKAIYNGVTGLAKDIIQAEVISKLLNKGDQLINKASKASKNSAILDTGYDAYNTIKSYAKGDMVGMGSNFVGALLPGVSGKTVEAVADNYIPKENQEGQDANAFIANYGTGPLGKQLLDTYGAGYKSSKAFKKDLKDGKLKDEQSIKKHLKNYKPTTTPIAIEKYAMGGRLPKLLLGGGVPPKKKYGAFGEPIPNGKFKGLRRNAEGQMKLIPEDDNLEEAVISKEGIPLYKYDPAQGRSRGEMELERDAIASNMTKSPVNAINAATATPGSALPKSVDKDGNGVPDYIQAPQKQANLNTAVDAGVAAMSPNASTSKTVNPNAGVRQMGVDGTPLPIIAPIPKPGELAVTPNAVSSTTAAAATKGAGMEGVLGTAAKLAPMLLDNIGNAIMSKNTPKLTTPLLNRAAPLETRVNINPQLAEIRRGNKAAKDTILNNTSNSNNAKTNAVMSDLNSAKQQNELLGNKENQELTLRNADSQNKQNISMSNNATMNQHAMNQYQRTNDIRTQVSGNLANLQGDVKTVMQMNQAKDNFDGYTMANLADDDNGSKMMSYMSNAEFMKDPKNRAFVLSRLEEKDADGKYKFEGQRLQAKRLKFL